MTFRVCVRGARVIVFERHTDTKHIRSVAAAQCIRHDRTHYIVDFVDFFVVVFFRSFFAASLLSFRIISMRLSNVPKPTAQFSNQTK